MRNKSRLVRIMVVLFLASTVWTTALRANASRGAHAVMEVHIGNHLFASICTECDCCDFGLLGCPSDHWQICSDYPGNGCLLHGGSCSNRLPSGGGL